MADVLPRYPIFIPTKGRATRATALTARCLLDDDVPFHVVVEPQEQAAYEDLVGADRVLVLPFSNLGLGSIPARNWIKDYSTDRGDARHWQLDDNIIEFRRFYRGKRIPCHAGVGLRVCEDFSDRYENVAVSGLNYQMFGVTATKPFVTNCHVYSCVAPETPILCADLVWRPAGTLQPGQKIVAFDEEPTYAGQGVNSRSYRTATIERNDPAAKPSYRIATDIGDPIEASGEHPWLVWRHAPLRRRGPNRGTDDLRRDGRLCWVETRDLRVGDRIAHLSRPWKRDATHEGGWVAGIYDGEGSLTIKANRGIQLAIAQKEGAVLDRLKAALTDRGYAVGVSDGRSVQTLRIGGGFIGALRFIGEFAPTRLLARAPSLWEGRGVRAGQSYELATVTSIESLGVRPVASITTSTGTFVTGGYLSHNCSLVNNAIPHRWRGRYNEDTDLCLQVLADGWCTVLVNVFLANKLRTMASKGGNTDDLYAGDGRLRMARSLERVWPYVVETRRRFERPQHVIRDSWRKFDTPLRLRADVDLAALPVVDEYGLGLQTLTTVRSESLRRLVSE